MTNVNVIYVWLMMRWHNFTKNVCLCLPTHLTSCWMSNIWNSIWTFVKSDTSFFFFSVKALLNLILEWKKGRKFTILCQGHGELKIYRQTARKCSIWVSIELFLKNNFSGNTPLISSQLNVLRKSCQNRVNWNTNIHQVWYSLKVR